MDIRIYYMFSKEEKNMETTTTNVKESNVLQNFALLCGSNAGWALTQEDSEWYFKTAVAGITDAVNILKNKSVPVAVMIQDLKGNKIIFACVEWVEADDSDEAATGNWTYFWSWDMADLPENATVYTIDQKQVLEIILNRGYNLCNMAVPSLSNLAQLAVYMFNLLHDTLDQEAVEEGHEWVLDFEGYFEAAVQVEAGKKTYSFTPKGEMKMLIKDDTAGEK